MYTQDLLYVLKRHTTKELENKMKLSTNVNSDNIYINKMNIDHNATISTQNTKIQFIVTQ